MFFFLSVLGVALGVAVLVIVQSVMGGFGKVHRERIVDTSGHLEISAGGYPFEGGYELAEQIPNLPADLLEDMDWGDVTQEMLEQMQEEAEGGPEFSEALDQLPEGEEMPYESPDQVEFRGDFKPEMVQLLMRMRMQQNPANPWRISEMAAAVSMSRSRFCSSMPTRAGRPRGRQSPKRIKRPTSRIRSPLLDAL